MEKRTTGQMIDRINKLVKLQNSIESDIARVVYLNHLVKVNGDIYTSIIAYNDGTVKLCGYNKDGINLVATMEYMDEATITVVYNQLTEIFGELSTEPPMQKKYVRITARYETYIEGDSMIDVRRQYEQMLNNENFDFVEYVSIEDADTNKDVWNEYFSAV